MIVKKWKISAGRWKWEKTIINLPNNNYDIKNMTLSTATNTIYLKVKMNKEEVESIE